MRYNAASSLLGRQWLFDEIEASGVFAPTEQSWLDEREEFKTFQSHLSPGTAGSAVTEGGS
jgi:hypothetical protein